MILSIGPLLAELAAESGGSPAPRLLPFALLAFIVLVMIAIFLGLKNLRRGDRDDEPDSR